MEAGYTSNIPVHHSASKVEYLLENCPTFIEPDLWSHNRADLNPMDILLKVNWRKLRTTELFFET